MTERIYLMTAGLSLLLFLYLELNYFVYAYIGILIFEGATNWRLPKIINLIRYGKNIEQTENRQVNYKINFEAERALRLVVAGILIATYIFFPNQAWFLPWFIGVMLTFAGVSRFCPMVMTLKWIGLR